VSPLAAATRRLLRDALFIVLGGVLIGLVFNGRMVVEQIVGPTPVAPPPELTETVETEAVLYPFPVSFDEMQELVAAGTLILDARPIELYREGHLPAARALPLDEAAEGVARLLQEEARDETVVVYCSGFGCPDSFDLAQQLLKAGFVDVRVFEGGFPQWRDAGLPIRRGEGE